MIILDTNVVSEPMRFGGNLSVKAWLDKQSADLPYITTISFAELMAGVEIRPAG